MPFVGAVRGRETCTAVCQVPRGAPFAADDLSYGMPVPYVEKGRTASTLPAKKTPPTLSHAHPFGNQTFLAKA